LVSEYNDPNTNAFYGQGVYATCKGPQEFGSLENVIDNNFRRMPQRCSQRFSEDNAFAKYRNRVRRYIPLIVETTGAYNVQLCCMLKASWADHGSKKKFDGNPLDEPGTPKQEKWVIRIIHEM